MAGLFRPLAAPPPALLLPPPPLSRAIIESDDALAGSLNFWLLLFISSSSLTRIKLVTSPACATQISTSLNDANRTIAITKQMRCVVVIHCQWHVAFNFVLCHRKKSDDLSIVRPRLTTDLSCNDEAAAATAATVAHPSAFSCLAVEIEWFCTLCSLRRRCCRRRWFIDRWCGTVVDSVCWQ